MNTDKNGQPVYIILGATGGIGTELSRQLAAQTAHLMLGSRTSEKLDKLAAELQAEKFVLDATQTGQVERCVEQTVETYGRVDGIAHRSTWSVWVASRTNDSACSSPANLSSFSLVRDPNIR